MISQRSSTFRGQMFKQVREKMNLQFEFIERDGDQIYDQPIL